MSFDDTAIVGLTVSKEDYDKDLSFLQYEGNLKSRSKLFEASECGNNVKIT